MLFAKLLCFVAALASNAAAADFYLKTSGATNPKYNDLYVESYHTGAGLSDAVLNSNVSVAAPFFLNGTYAQFDEGQGYPWGIELASTTNYAAWEFVTINTGYGTSNFSIANNELVWQGSDQFDGWLACDWYHEAPQLFWIVKYYSAASFPDTCSRVTLSTVPVGS